MTVLRFTLITLLTLVLVGCSSETLDPITPTVNPTPNIEATVQARVTQELSAVNPSMTESERHLDYLQNYQENKNKPTPTIDISRPNSMTPGEAVEALLRLTGSTEDRIPSQVQTFKNNLKSQNDPLLAFKNSFTVNQTLIEKFIFLTGYSDYQKPSYATRVAQARTAENENYYTPAPVPQATPTRRPPTATPLPTLAQVNVQPNRDEDWYEERKKKYAMSVPTPTIRPTSTIGPTPWPRCTRFLMPMTILGRITGNSVSVWWSNVELASQSNVKLNYVMSVPVCHEGYSLVGEQYELRIDGVKATVGTLGQGATDTVNYLATPPTPTPGASSPPRSVPTPSTPRPTSTPLPEVYLSLGQFYEASNGLSVSLNELNVKTIGNVYQINISYSIANHSPNLILEGSWKVYYKGGGGKPQYGFFNNLVPGELIFRDYSFNIEAPDVPTVLAYPGRFFEDSWERGDLKWKIE